MATIVNISGSGDINYCYAKINGTSYIGEASNITLKSNTIVFEVFGAGGNPGTVTIDGNTVLTYELGNATYSWAVPSNVTEINIVLTDKNFYTTVTVTTKKSGDSGGGDGGEHYTLISGTAREIESGTVLIGGVLREIESGLVLVGGVAREIAFGSAKAKVSQLSVGDVVFAPVNGVQKEFIVVHQGIPSSLYDSSCDGTWLLMKDCVAQDYWTTANVGTDYSKSNAHTYVSGTFLGMLSTELKNKIKTVKIPYYGSSVQSGANGLSTQAFLLSARELGFNGGTYMPKDGETLSYFNGASAADKIAYLNGTAVKWHTRTPWVRYSNPYSYFVTTTGSYDYTAGLSAGIRPAFILDPETQYDPNTMEILEDGSGGSGGGSAKNYTVTIKGTGSTNYQCVEINGIVYYGPATLEVPAGTDIICYVTSTKAGNEVTVDGAVVASGQPATYTHKVTSNVMVLLSFETSKWSGTLKITTS